MIKLSASPTAFKRLAEVLAFTLRRNDFIFDQANSIGLKFGEYLPTDMPFSDVKSAEYMQAVVEQIEALIAGTYSHTLILFTSYRMIEQVFAELGQCVNAYPLFMMGKSRLNVLDDFRKSGNGVLFASDSAGEGIDLTGNILSLLIVVRLPFLIPNPIAEYEKLLYSDFYGYLNEVIVPGMLIKLCQWIGRDIHWETDTAVLSILDSTAHGRYRNNILASVVGILSGCWCPSEIDKLPCGSASMSRTFLPSCASVRSQNK